MGWTLGQVEDFDMNNVERRLLDLVERRSGQRPGLDDPLTALGIDSIEMADFIGVLEEEFRIRVDADIMDVERLAELAHYIETHS